MEGEPLGNMCLSYLGKEKSGNKLTLWRLSQSGCLASNVEEGLGLG